MPAKITVPALLGALCCIPAFSQMAYRESRNISDWQNAFPSEGAASARFNPAALAEARLASCWGAYGASVTGKSGRMAFQAAVGIPPEHGVLPIGVAAGLGYTSRGSRVDGANATYQESEINPAFAIAYPASLDAPWRLSAGLAMPMGRYDAFNAVESSTRGMDAGILGAYRLRGMGRFGLGFAYHYLSSPRIKLPESGSYAIPGWTAYSAEWTAAGGMVRAYLDLYANESPDPAGGPMQEDRVGLNGWEIEVRPLPWLGLKFERTRISRQSTLGAIFRPALPWDRTRAFLALDIGHDRVYLGDIPFPFRKFIFGERGRDEGRGLLFNLALGAEI